jgi:hypothetical protein
MWEVHGVCVGFLCLCAPAVLYARARMMQSSKTLLSMSEEQQHMAESINLTTLQRKFLAVLLFAKFADWLQGPYFFEVYASKVDASTGISFTLADISLLFLARTSAAVVFGAFAGSWADTFGRYCVTAVFKVQLLDKINV